MPGLRSGGGVTARIRTAAATTAVLLGWLLPIVGAPPAAAAACDEVLVPGDAWMGGIGVDIRSNGPYTGTEASCRPLATDLSGPLPQWGFGWQCVELVNRLYMTRGWITATWPGNGADMYTLAPASLSKELQGSVQGLAPGDVVVFGGDLSPGAGHVAVVSAVDGSTVKLYGQNALTP